MEFLNKYLALPMVQQTGNIAFLAAVGLIMGSCLMAFFAEFKKDSGSRDGHSVLSGKLTGAVLPWIILFALFGGTATFIPQLSSLKHAPGLQILGLSAGLSFLFYLLYHFGRRFLKIGILRALIALLAVGSALTAAAWWYLPHTCADWRAAAAGLSSGQEIFQWWLGREEVARFGIFKTMGIAFAALIFLIANAREKEKKRKQPREYYFKAAAYAEFWLLLATTLAVIPANWVYYNHTLGKGLPLFQAPGIYWYAGAALAWLLGWLLLIKIIRDGLVNRRATVIIFALFLISFGLFHLGPATSGRMKVSPDKTSTGNAVTSGTGQTTPAQAPTRARKRADTPPVRPEPKR